MRILALKDSTPSIPLAFHVPLVCKPMVARHPAPAPAHSSSFQMPTHTCSSCHAPTGISWENFHLHRDDLLFPVTLSGPPGARSFWRTCLDPCPLRASPVGAVLLQVAVGCSSARSPLSLSKYIINTIESPPSFPFQQRGFELQEPTAVN